MEHPSFLRSLRFLLKTNHSASARSSVDDWLPQIQISTNYTHTEAVVENEIEPGKFGRVRYQASRWKARCDSATAIAKDSRVRVLGRQGLTLIVEPIEAVCL